MSRAILIMLVAGGLELPARRAIRSASTTIDPMRIELVSNSLAVQTAAPLASSCNSSTVLD